MFFGFCWDQTENKKNFREQFLGVRDVYLFGGSFQGLGGMFWLDV